MERTRESASEDRESRPTHEEIEIEIIAADKGESDSGQYKSPSNGKSAEQMVSQNLFDCLALSLRWCK